MRRRYVYLILGVILLLLSLLCGYLAWQDDKSHDLTEGRKGRELGGADAMGSEPHRSSRRVRRGSVRSTQKRMLELIGGKVLELEEVDPPLSDKGEDFKDYWDILAEGNTIEDVRAVEPSDTTDLREFALSLPMVVRTRNDNGYKHVYNRSKAAPYANTWTMPGDGAQYPFKVRRSKPGINGEQRIELEMGLYRESHSKLYIHIAKLERRDEGWFVIDAKLYRPKQAQQVAAPDMQ